MGFMRYIIISALLAAAVSQQGCAARTGGTQVLVIGVGWMRCEPVDAYKTDVAALGFSAQEGGDGFCAAAGPSVRSVLVAPLDVPALRLHRNSNALENQTKEGAE